MAAVKYKNRREYLDFYADEAVRRLGSEFEAMRADCLIPVPVHPKRYRSRGFNQALVLAQKELGPSARLKNLEKAFTAEKIPPGLERVILVDDIYTTGSTAEACTRALKAAGVKNVYFFAVCIGQGQ